MKTVQSLLVLLLAAVVTACGGGQRRSAAESSAAGQVRPLHEFVLPQPPVTFERAQQFEYVRDHFWDDFRFSDTTALASADTMALLRRFGLYASLLSPEPTNGEPVRRLMQRAAVSRPMFELFCFLAEQVLHDPNSPLRNDEHYIPVLEAQLAAPWYDEYERIAPAFDLEMAQKNRLGQPAADFRYTTADGRTRSLYDLKADYVLLFFNNPDCGMCKDLREQIGASQVLAPLIASGRLKVLALYPDEDLQAWHNYRPHIPANWINAYDKGCLIREQNLYAIDAIPSLYLLDGAKRVLAKDSTDVGALEVLVQE